MQRNDAQINNAIFKTMIGMLLVCTAAASALGFMFYNAGQENKRQEQSQERKQREEEETAEIKSQVTRNVIYDNIFINEINVGGMTKAEALEKLNTEAEDSTLGKKLEITKGGESYPFTFGELGVSHAIKEAVDIAWDYARAGSDKERYDKITELAANPLKITAEYRINEDLTREKLSELAAMLYIKPINAGMVKEGGSFRITKEQSGEKLNEEATLSGVLQKLRNNEEGYVEAVMEEALPLHTTEAFANAQSLLGSYLTIFSAGENGRNTNLKTAASKINGSVLYPGEVFSTNAAFGAMTYDNGYRPAPVIINGKLEDDFGGGVCQVSSTLYMAALYAELEITERRNHSLKVGYLPFAYDATLAGNYIDLKFKNNLKAPIYIESIIQDGNKVVVNIYGEETRSSNRKLEFQNALVETVQPPEDEIINDNTLPLGQRIVTSTPKTGYKYNLYKIVYEDNREVERVLINVSTYRAVKGEVRVGTGPAEATPAVSVETDPIPEPGYDSDPPDIIDIPEPQSSPDEPVLPEPQDSPDEPVLPEPQDSPDEPVISEPQDSPNEPDMTEQTTDPAEEPEPDLDEDQGPLMPE